MSGLNRTSTAAILRTESLTRKYGELVALDNLDLAVHPGEVFGYIGPNGAGKTSTFRILCGLLDPSSGRALINEQDVTGNKDRIKQLVGFLPDNFGIYPSLRVWEYLDFFAAAYRIERGRRTARIETCLRIANASEFADKLMGSLSRGMKQRVGIAKTLLHDPPVLILDEPAATLDPRARVEMRRLLRDLAELGKAVLVSSHILPELAEVCDRVGILSAGRMIACGPVRDIMKTVRPRRLIELRTLAQATRVQEILRNSPGHWQLVEVPNGDGAMRFEVEADEQQLSQALATLIGDGIAVTGFAEVPADLEEVFMKLTH
jgi:ABC-2 type transport system ATP-binding protein